MCPSQHNHEDRTHQAVMTRRGFFQKGAATVTGGAALAAALSPLADLDPDHMPDIEKLLQKHYKEMSPAELQEVLQRISQEVEQRYKISAEVQDLKPLDGVEFAYALNLSRCIGCRKCVHACVDENNQSRNPEIQYIRMIMLTSYGQRGDATRRKSIGFSAYLTKPVK